jgi:hypothetical protein
MISKVDKDGPPGPLMKACPRKLGQVRQDSQASSHYDASEELYTKFLQLTLQRWEVGKLPIYPCF